MVHNEKEYKIRVSCLNAVQEISFCGTVAWCGERRRVADNFQLYSACAWWTSGIDKHVLVRMSVTVAMTPRAWATADVQERRKEGFRQGRSFNHCPRQAGTSTGTFHAQPKKGYHSVELTDSQRVVL